MIPDQEERNDDMKIPKGYQFSGIAAGIKETGRKDLALIVSEVPAVAVATFTTSLAPAAPVQLGRKVLQGGCCQAVVINSGNANAATGARGLKDAHKTQTQTARLLKILPEWVVVSSTGKIGTPLPINKVVKGLSPLVAQLSSEHFQKAAEAILTTDKSVKVGGFTGRAGARGCTYTLVALAKGAGMVEPHMKSATMLAYFLTDLKISLRELDPIFQNAVEQSFNRITIDGDMSTNDTTLLMANGLAENTTPSTRDKKYFFEQLTQLMQDLARQMVADGEGATKVVRIEVKRAKNNDQARKIAYAVGNSPLVKTSFYGEDPNWGRVLGAAARAGAAFDPDRVDVSYGAVLVARDGVTTGPKAEGLAKKLMKKQDFTVTLDLHLGSGSHWILASDLTLGYVRLNANYRT